MSSKYPEEIEKFAEAQVARMHQARKDLMTKIVIQSADDEMLQDCSIEEQQTILKLRGYDFRLLDTGWIEWGRATNNEWVPIRSFLIKLGEGFQVLIFEKK